MAQVSGVAVWWYRALRLAGPLGLIGGVAGLVASGVAIYFDGLAAVVITAPVRILISNTLLGVAWALMGIMGSIMHGRDPKVGSSFMMAGGIGGLVSIPGYFFAPAALLLAGGILQFFKKESP